MRLPDAIRRTFVAATCVVALVGTAVSAGAAPSADPVERYVTQVYEDLFHRQPDPGGLAGWRDALNAGMPRQAVANAISSSTEYRSRLVTGVYQRFLGRTPDDGGLQGWVAAMASGWTVAQIEAGFLASDELYHQAGSTPAGWVTRLYADVLDRVPSTAEVDEWVRVMSLGPDRYQVSMGFLLSTEHLVTVVDGYYMDLLGRHLDPAGQRGWVGALQAGERDENIIGGIIGSPEYWYLATDVPTINVEVPEGTVRAGQPVSFTVTALDANGAHNVSAEATVTLGGRATECRGATCIPTVVGVQTVTASWHGGSASSSVSVVAGPVASLVITPTTTTLPDGGSVVFSAAGRDALGNPVTEDMPTIVYAVDGDPAACVASRCRPVGAGDHRVTASVSGSPAVSASATVRVAAPGPVRFRAWEWGVPSGSTSALPSGGDGVQIGTTSQWASLSHGSRFTLALKSDGSLWSWGDNNYGELGDGTLEPHAAPEQVGSRTDWVAVDARYSSVAAIAADGSLWVWGEVLSKDGPRRVSRPERLGSDSDWSSVRVGGYFTLAIKRDGSLWSWGYNELGQLGDGTKVGRTTPARVGTGTWSSIAAGDSHALGIAADGTLWTWGLIVRGPFTTNNTVAVIPQLVDPRTDWRVVDAGFDVSAAIRADGTLWTWGVSSSRQQLGDGVPARTTPGQVGVGTSWSDVSVGSSHMVALDSSGGLWTWGDPDEGGPATALSLPTRLGSMTGWTSVSAGFGHTVALRP